MNESLQAAIRERIALGYSRGQIITELQAAGYTLDTAGALYDQVNGVATMAPPIPPPPVSPPSPSTPPSTQVVSSTAPPSPPPAPPPPPTHQPLSEAATEELRSYTQSLSTPQQHTFAPGLLIAVVVLLLIGGGVAFGMKSGVISLAGLFGGAPYATEAEMMTGLVGGTRGMTAYGFNSRYELAIEPKDPASPTLSDTFLSADELDELAEGLALAPAEGNLTFTASGLLDRRDVQNQEFDVSMQLNIMAEPFFINTAASLRLVDGTLYGKIDRIPANFRSFLPAIPENVWILLLEEQVLAPGRNTAPSLPSKALQVLEERLPPAISFYLQEAIRLSAVGQARALAIANERQRQLASGVAALGLDTSLSAEEREMLEQLFTLLTQYPPLRLVGEPERVTAQGETLYRYAVDIDHDNLRLYILNAIKEAERITGETAPITDSDIDDILPSRDVIAEINRLTDIVLLFRPDGSPAGGSVDGILALDHPDITSQLRLSLAVSYTRQNDGMNITAPTDLHPETLEEIMGRGAGSDTSVKQSLSRIRAAAELSYNRNNYQYGDVCADPDIQILLFAIVNHLEDIPSTARDGRSGPHTITCNDQAKSYAVTAPLPSDGTRLWCIDSTGFFGEASPDTLSSGSDTTCDPIKTTTAFSTPEIPAVRGLTDQTIKQSLEEIRRHVEMLPQTAGGGGYNGVCQDDQVYRMMLTLGQSYPASIGIFIDSNSSSNYIVCNDNQKGFAVAAPTADGEKIWCVDSMGSSRDLESYGVRYQSVVCGN